MRIFIFGAGASIGSQAPYKNNLDEQHRAPLTNDLFNEVYFPYARNLAINTKNFERLRAKLTSETSLEKLLTEEWKNMATYKQLSKKRATEKKFGEIAFYIWWMMQNISAKYNNENLYHLFIEKVTDKDEPFSIINFNYDTQLDQAYQNAGGIVLEGSLENYTKSNYFKPHGSVNWLLKKRDIDTGVTTSGTSLDKQIRISRAISLFFNNGEPIPLQVTVKDPADPDLNNLGLMAASDFSHQYFYPLIFLPLSIKQYELITDFRNIIMDRAKEMMAKATEIYLIGYKAQDDIIHELLDSTKDKTLLNVVGRSSSETISDNILKRHPSLNKNLIYTEGFENFIKII